MICYRTYTMFVGKKNLIKIRSIIPIPTPPPSSTFPPFSDVMHKISEKEEQLKKDLRI